VIRAEHSIPILFGASVLLQRFSLPGGVIALLLPVVLLWCAVGWWQGWLELDRQRTWLFLVAACATALTALAQGLLVSGARLSVLSWGLFITVWAPAALRLVDRSREALVGALRVCVGVGVALAAACVGMVLAQLVGWQYRDVVADVVPASLLVDGYVITYPLSYTSPIMRANALIGLEPSIVSLQLGVALVLALVVRSRPWVLGALLLGLVCTASGSGLFVVAIALVVMLAHPIRRRLLPLLVPAGVAVALLALTPQGQGIAARITESTVAGSSTSLRALQPYAVAWPQWISDPLGVLVGWGAGSSQALMSATRIPGLLVPSPMKVFYDYGLIAGVLLACFLLACYVGGPLRSLSLALLASSWLLQPGTTTVVLVLPTLLFVTWWAPRIGAVVEMDPPTTGERAEKLETVMART